MPPLNPQKICTHGHYYEGNVCPYCQTKLYPDYINSPSTPPAKQNHTSCYHIRSKVPSPNRGIPLCSHCGKPVRNNIPTPLSGEQISSINNLCDGVIPWNFQWDGRCENCGHDFNFVMCIDLGSTGPDNKIRKTKVKAGTTTFPHHITCGLNEWRATVLSGVVIETELEAGQKKIFFLSSNEMKYLMEVLQNSPLLEQKDYYIEDYT